MKLSPSLFILIILLMVPAIIIAQKQQFNVGLVAGLNKTPILLYQHGINAGIFATRSISEKHGFRIEILLTQNGDNIQFNDIPHNRSIIRTYFVETPIYFDWKWFPLEEQQRFDFELVYNVGLAYSRAVSVLTEDTIDNTIKEELKFSNKNSVLFNTGLIFTVAKRFGLNIDLKLPIRKTEINPTYAFRVLYLLNKS